MKYKDPHIFTIIHMNSIINRFSAFVVSLFFVAGVVHPYTARAGYTHNPRGASIPFNIVNQRPGILYDTFYDTERFEIEFPDKFLNSFEYKDSDGDNAPDKIERLAELLESTWLKFQDMGYETPRAAFNVLELYVLVDDDETLLDNSLLGFATLGENGEGVPDFPYIVLNSNFLYPEKGEVWDAKTEAKYENLFYAAAVHELFHLFQFSYAPEFVYSYYDVNFAEGSADWITDVILPDNEMYQLEIPDYLDNPEYSLFGTSRPSNSGFKYGTAIWAKFLEERYGQAIVTRIFQEYFKRGIEQEEWQNTVQGATEFALSKYKKTTLENAYREFTIWNYDKSRYKEGNEYTDVKIQETVSSFPFDRETATVGEFYARPRLFGSNYIVFETKGKGKDLTVDFEGHKDAKWAVTFLSESDGEVEEVSKTILFPTESEKSITVDNADRFEKIIMIVSVIGSKNPFDFATNNGYSYGYFARMDGEATTNNSGVSFASNYSTWNSESGRTGFSDLLTTHKNYDAILYLKENNVINGYPDGTFQPERTINRAELMKILVTNQNLTPDPAVYGNCFPDVTDEWFAPYVCYAKSKDWVSGYPDGTFKPDGVVNKVEALKMILKSRAVPLPSAVSAMPFSDTSTSDWYAPYVEVAYSLGMLEEQKGGAMNPAGGMNRGGAGENIYRLLQLVQMGPIGAKSELKLPNARDYMGLVSGGSWTYKDEETQGTSTHTVSDDCSDYPECFVIEDSEGRDYLYLEGGELKSYKSVGDMGIFTTTPHQIIFSGRNFRQYIKVRGDAISLESEGVPIVYNLKDGVVDFEILDGEEEVTVPAGTFTTRKFKSTGAFKAEGTLTMQDGTRKTVKLSILSESLSYIAAGVGDVRTETISTVTLFGEGLEDLEPIKTESVNVLVEYSL